MADILTPFVYWAQTEHQITLKVCIDQTILCSVLKFL